jgi:hypothetical protein
MKLVYLEGTSLELRWMWLPTFMGQNHGLMRELESAGKKKFTGKSLPPSEEALEEAHQWVIDWLCKKNPIPGLREYLEAIKNVQE